MELGKRANIENHFAYSQASDSINTTGRLTIDTVQHIVKTQSAHFYLCGTHDFMTSMVEGLIQWGVNKADIHYEFFSQFQPLGDSAEQAESHEVHFLRSGTKVYWSPASGSLLDLAEKNGITVSHGCRYGICEACGVKLINGEVRKDENTAELNLKDSILLCSTRPISDIGIDL